MTLTPSQNSLLDLLVSSRGYPARKGNPFTSHAAAREVLLSGQVSRDSDLLDAWVKRHPGKTVGALAALPGAPLDRYQMQKRASSSSSQRGPAVHCPVTGRWAQTMWPEGAEVPETLRCRCERCEAKR